MTRDRIRFLFGDRVEELGDIDPTLTVLDWLRLERSLCGTKEGCAEGDCGACTVVIGRPDGERVVYEPVNACIRFLPTLDGCHLLTVEQLKGQDGVLHPVQKAMVECHASQCGFCTPGFVMSLFALYLSADKPDEDTIRDALAGNLCRCTGYAPIIAAARRMGELGDRASDGPLTATAQLAEFVGPNSSETLIIAQNGRRFIAPSTVDALADILLETPDATIVAGATDVGLWVTKQMRVLRDVVYVGGIPELRRIVETGDGLEIGGAATYVEAVAALARLYPDFGELIRRIGGLQVRTVGTIGGNIANGSPIGDSPPALIAIGATLVLRRGAERREMPLEDFYIAYGKQDRLPGEFVERVFVPKPRPGAMFRVYKISKRFDQDISALCGAFLVETNAAGIVSRVRIAFGGMAGTPKRAERAEAALLGRPWTVETARTAAAALRDDYTPLSDWRASADYRSMVAGNLLLKFFAETAGIETRLVGAGRVVHA
jgi:xanthine dehydrogenase small subunit